MSSWISKIFETESSFWKTAHYHSPRPYLHLIHSDLSTWIARIRFSQIYCGSWIWRGRISAYIPPLLPLTVSWQQTRVEFSWTFLWIAAREQYLPPDPRMRCGWMSRIFVSGTASLGQYKDYTMRMDGRLVHFSFNLVHCINILSF